MHWKNIITLKGNEQQNKFFRVDIAEFQIINILTAVVRFSVVSSPVHCSLYFVTMSFSSFQILFVDLLHFLLTACNYYVSEITYILSFFMSSCFSK